ncbi:MAG: DUF2589 domain-containing protein [Fibromonadales bacterium]|nr:DUF2589 domain-containing protein [Fibromonadales bacterium]
MADSVASKFQGLPIAELISAPLKAACDSQKMLALSAFEYVMQIGFEDGKKTRLISFDLERPILESPGSTSKIKVNAPFLGLVPLPSLLIDDVQIDFQMEVTDTTTEKSNTSAEVSTSAEASYGFFAAKAKVNIAGKVTSSRENTRSTNQTAKYQVHVSARQQQPTEGLSKLMDIMAACIEPLPESSK